MIPFVGLTGGIGSGKSAVSALFEGLGVPVVDADVVSHQLSQTELYFEKIEQIFGKKVFDQKNKINRARLRKMVFAYQRKKRQLERFMHPLILRECVNQMCIKHGCYGILVVPLLFEKKNFLSLVDRTLLVDCPESLQIERVKQRNGLKTDVILNIMSGQMSRQNKLALADDVIENTRDKNWLGEEVARLHRFYSDYYCEHETKREGH